MIADSEQELLDILQHMFPDSKTNKLRKMLTEGRVEVDGKIVHKAKQIISKGRAYYRTRHLN